MIVSHVDAEGLMALLAVARQFRPLCEETVRAQLMEKGRPSCAYGPPSAYGLPPLQCLALIQRSRLLCEGWGDDVAAAEVRYCTQHGRLRHLRRGAVTRAQMRDAGVHGQLECERRAWACDHHFPELLTAMTLVHHHASVARRRAAGCAAHSSSSSGGDGGGDSGGEASVSSSGTPAEQQQASPMAADAAAAMAATAAVASPPSGCPALLRLARSKDVRVLLTVVLNEDAVAASAAAKALGQLGGAPRARAVCVPSLVAALRWGREHELPHGARALQEMARRHAAAIAAMLDAGAIPALVALLQGDSDRSKRNGAAALKSLAKRDKDAARAMVAAGGVPALVALLHTGSSAVRLRSKAVLRSLVRHVPEARDAIVPVGPDIIPAAE